MPRGATPAEVALAWLLGLSPVIVAIPGARRPETARSAARAAGLDLDAERARRPRAGRSVARGGAPDARPGAGDDAEVVLVMGIPGAGKSRVAERVRRAGLRAVSTATSAEGLCVSWPHALDEQLSSGVAARRARQHLPHAGGAKLRRSRRRPAIRFRRGACGSTRRWRRPRSTSSSACSSGSARSRLPMSCAQLARREPG